MRVLPLPPNVVGVDTVAKLSPVDCAAGKPPTMRKVTVTTLKPKAEKRAKKEKKS